MPHRPDASSEDYPERRRFDRRTKVVFLIGSLHVGGSETQLAELASRLDRDVFDVIVCAMTGGPLETELRAKGVRVHPLGFISLRAGPWWKRPRALAVAVRATLRFWTILRRERPDIVHGFLIEAYLLGTFLGRLAGVPYVVASRRSLGSFKEKKYVYLFLEGLADRLTDLFIANSDAVRTDTLAREPIKASDIIVIRNGLDLTRFDALATPAGPGRRGGPRVIVVCNLIGYKGHEFFLRAWPQVLNSFPDAEAVLVGDGVLRGHLEAMARALDIGHSVEFLGVRRDIPELLASADLYVHPSLQEGYSNALLEAMASGRAVVATAVGGNVEMVDDGDTGVLVTPADAQALADAMLSLLRDPQRAQAMGRRAQAAARGRHDMAVVVRQYEATYADLLRGDRSFRGERRSTIEASAPPR